MKLVRYEVDGQEDDRTSVRGHASDCAPSKQLLTPRLRLMHLAVRRSGSAQRSIRLPTTSTVWPRALDRTKRTFGLCNIRRRQPRLQPTDHRQDIGHYTQISGCKRLKNLQSEQTTNVDVCRQHLIPIDWRSEDCFMRIV